MENFLKGTINIVQILKYLSNNVVLLHNFKTSRSSKKRPHLNNKVKTDAKFDLKMSYKKIHKIAIKKLNKLDEIMKIFEENNFNVETRLIMGGGIDKYVKEVVEKEEFDIIILYSKLIHAELKQLVEEPRMQKYYNLANCGILLIHKILEKWEFIN